MHVFFLISCSVFKPSFFYLLFLNTRHPFLNTRLRSLYIPFQISLFLSFQPLLKLFKGISKRANSELVNLAIFQAIWRFPLSRPVEFWPGWDIKRDDDGSLTRRWEGFFWCCGEIKKLPGAQLPWDDFAKGKLYVKDCWYAENVENNYFIYILIRNKKNI